MFRGLCKVLKRLRRVLFRKYLYVLKKHRENRKWERILREGADPPSLLSEETLDWRNFSRDEYEVMKLNVTPTIQMVECIEDIIKEALLDGLMQTGNLASARLAVILWYEEEVLAACYKRFVRMPNGKWMTLKHDCRLEKVGDIKAELEKGGRCLLFEEIPRMVE